MYNATYKSLYQLNSVIKMTRQNPRQALNKAFIRAGAIKNEFEKFKVNLLNLIQQIDDNETEEFHKNIVADFLKNTYYSPDFFINTKKSNDFVIYNGKDTKSSVGVIIEAKKPNNTSEMLKVDNLNTKALQQLVFYFLEERITNKNLEIKYLIATNIYEWFIFDAEVFEKAFAKRLEKQFIDFKENRLSGSKTDFFYKQIAQPAIDQVKNDLGFTYFDLRDYEPYLTIADQQNDKELIALFKLFSPQHLLKLPFANDSNSLNKNFYHELLHIIGLTEVKEGSKKLIQRKPIKEREQGSLIENTITRLRELRKIYRLENSEQFRENQEEILVNVSIELAITWINRILFLKLLEAQLIRYHQGDKSFAFLNWAKIPDFGSLNRLFFGVLSHKPDDRDEHIKNIVANIPYLNSSLFELSDLEHQTLVISNLLNDEKLSIFSTTVLKDNNGNKRTGKLTALEYIFQFLDAYNFSSEGAEEIQEENKTLINASVLGLIFEKINGYKDGSFFTPGFITMYMCQETIRRAVIQKFNEVKGWDCQNINELYDKIDNKKEANDIINSLKICDPAVGSGHFLVSALNEIIAIKSELKILLDREGKTLRDYHVEVVNDELIITDDDGQTFAYNPKNKESQRIQETIFHEKQIIIENCLFGVDINPNSVKICCLRLWIELLKNAYYTAKSNYRELETLPNIDINIKVGNSLVSRFSLDDDLRPILRKSAWNIEGYRNAIITYRHPENKDQKLEIEKLIKDIKNNIRTEISSNDPNIQKRNQKIAELRHLRDQTSLFEESKAEQKSRHKKQEKLEAEINELNNEIEDKKSGKIYQDAFEWRFEFPEVLNNEGDFLGFDVVIGNPPYGLFNKKQNQKISLTTESQILELIKKEYPQAKGGVINAYKVFYCLGIKLAKSRGLISMIIPLGILNETSSESTRKYLLLENSIILIDAFPERDNSKMRVFEDVKMSTTIIITQKGLMTQSFSMGISYEKNIELMNRKILRLEQVSQLDDNLQIPLLDSISFDLLCKCCGNSQVIKLGNISSCLTGEVDMTLAKTAITNNSHDQILVKGVQIDRYILKHTNSEISQGMIQYLNIVNFRELYNGEKLIHAQQTRIILQGLTGINERRRLKCTIVEGGIYLANSCNYIVCNDNSRRIFLLGILNSSLMNWIFKARSTSSNVNGYEVDNLPIIFPEEPYFLNKILEKVNGIIAIKQANLNADTRALEQEIDQLVYQLYGLTEEEIKIVESNQH
ncbi:MAG: Eco57I restriction-modification methylase domain-containing protein [Sphaerospermopsis kisseleviana]